MTHEHYKIQMTMSTNKFYQNTATPTGSLIIYSCFYLLSRSGKVE